MSGFSTPRDGAVSAQPKQISNRLLNMKFMQRAAASTTQKPGNSSPSTPTGQPLPKRRRTGDYISTPSNPTTPSSALTPTYSDRTAISGALSAEAQSLSISSRIHNPGRDGDETEWVLNIHFPAVTNGKNVHPSNGIRSENETENDEEDYDSDEDDQEEEDHIWSPSNPIGRQTYGSFNRKKHKTKPTNNTTTGTVADDNDNSSKISTKKRTREDLDDGEISSGSDLGSGSDDNDSFKGEDEDEDEFGSATRSQSKKKKIGNTFDFRSEADLKRMDSMDFQKKAFEHGLGRQRAGLSGGGGGTVMSKSPGHHHTTITTPTKTKAKKKARKSR